LLLLRRRAQLLVLLKDELLALGRSLVGAVEHLSLRGHLPRLLLELRRQLRQLPRLRAAQLLVAPRELLVLPSKLLVLLVLRLQALRQRSALCAQHLRRLLLLAPCPVGRLALDPELSRHLLRAPLLHVRFVELLLQLEPVHQWK